MKLNKHYSELNESYLFSTIAHKVAAYQKANPDKDIIRLGIGDVTLPLAKSVTDAMLKAVEEQGKKETFHGYIPSEQGYEFLRSAIQKYYAGHGVELDMAEIFVSDGAKSDLGNLLDLFDVDNTVLVPDPVYPVYVDDNVMAGRKILYMSASAENNFLPMPDDNVHADIVYLCSPNNPTGSVLSLEEMRELVEIAKSVDAWIICDEMYRGLDEEYMPSFADLYDKAIVTASSSKVYSMAGTRVGWIVCHDAETRKRLFNWRSYDSICGGVFDEWIFAIALEHVDKIFERSRRIVNANKVVIDKWIEKNPYLHQYADAHGTTYLVHYDLDVPAEKFCDDLLDQKGVLVCHGDCFYIPHTFRITLSHAHELEEGLRRIDEYIDELVAQGKAIKN